MIFLFLIIQFLFVRSVLVFLQTFLILESRNLVPRVTVMMRGRGEREVVRLLRKSKHQVGFLKCCVEEYERIYVLDLKTKEQEEVTKRLVRLCVF